MCFTEHEHNKTKQYKNKHNASVPKLVSCLTSAAYVGSNLMSDQFVTLYIGSNSVLYK